MFCLPCITVYQYRETNLMHFLFSLLRIKGLYMFQALLAHPQEALNKRHLEWNANRHHHTHAIYQVPFVGRLLRMSKECSKHVKALNS
jgi:hypothetical protein